MAAATKTLPFAVTASTSYENPYALARKYATPDHVTNGRIGWNIVTSFLHNAMKAFGLEEETPHDERYARAEEYMEVVYKLLQGSWKDGARVEDKESGLYSDPSKVRRIEHEGEIISMMGECSCTNGCYSKHFKLSATNQLYPSRQRDSSYVLLTFQEYNAELIIKQEQAKHLLRNTQRPYFCQEWSQQA